MDARTDYSETPLSRLLSDDNIMIMENLIPYCNSSLGRALAIQIKLMELNKIITASEDRPFLRACGFEEKKDSIESMESMLRTLKNSVSEEKASQINSILQMIQFSRMYQQFSEITKEHPEFFGGQNSGGSSNTKAPDPFSDPSLFLMLNSLMNNEEGSGDKMKKFFDLASSGNGENRDFNALLSSLLKGKM